MAYVQLRDGAEADPDALREHCRDQIAHYKVPKYIEAIDEFYDEHVSMQANLNPPVVGKAANRERERQFFGGDERRGAHRHIVGERCRAGFAVRTRCDASQRAAECGATRRHSAAKERERCYLPRPSSGS